MWLITCTLILQHHPYNFIHFFKSDIFSAAGKLRYFKYTFLKSTKYSLQILHSMRIYMHKRIYLDNDSLFLHGTWFNNADEKPQGLIFLPKICYRLFRCRAQMTSLSLTFSIENNVCFHSVYLDRFRYPTSNFGCMTVSDM